MKGTTFALQNEETNVLHCQHQVHVINVWSYSSHYSLRQSYLRWIVIHDAQLEHRSV